MGARRGPGLGPGPFWPGLGLHGKPLPGIWGRSPQFSKGSGGRWRTLHGHVASAHVPLRSFYVPIRSSLGTETSANCASRTALRSPTFFSRSLTFFLRSYTFQACTRNAGQRLSLEPGAPNVREHTLPHAPTCSNLYVPSRSDGTSYVFSIRSDEIMMQSYTFLYVPLRSAKLFAKVCCKVIRSFTLLLSSYTFCEVLQKSLLASSTFLYVPEKILYVPTENSRHDIFLCLTFLYVPDKVQ